MRVVAGFASFFVLCGIPAVAQSSPPPATTLPQGTSTVFTERLQPNDATQVKVSTVVTWMAPRMAGCPIDMRVRQRMSGFTVAVDDNVVRRRVFAPRLRLFLNDLRKDMAGHKIVSAAVTVHGTNQKARMQPLDGHSGGHGDPDSGDVEKTLNVGLAEWDEPGVSGDFRLPGFTSTSRVDLLSITYEDGSTWKLSGAESCHVAPDPLMLISH